jgi:GNAT superfamily N-acetyltransferase
MQKLDQRVWLAHGDAWQAEGRLRESFGGGALELPGARLSASGLPHPQWNNVDLVDVERFDRALVSDWYATRAFGAGVPWGVCVPAGRRFSHGRFLFAKRNMALLRAEFVAAAAPANVTLGAAGSDDLETIVRLDAAAFEGSAAEIRPWIAPHIGAPGFVVAVARIEGDAAGIATAVLTDDRAGRCAGIFGVAVAARMRRRGIGAALTSWLVERAFDDGATLAFLNPNHEQAARVYARLGFSETAGFDIYVDL